MVSCIIIININNYCNGVNYFIALLSRANRKTQPPVLDTDYAYHCRNILLYFQHAIRTSKGQLNGPIFDEGRLSSVGRRVLLLISP